MSPCVGRSKKPHFSCKVTAYRLGPGNIIPVCTPMPAVCTLVFIPHSHIPTHNAKHHALSSDTEACSHAPDTNNESLFSV